MNIKLHIKAEADNVIWITHEQLPVQVWQAVVDSVKDLGGQQFGGTGSAKYSKKLEGASTAARLRGWGQQLADRIKLRCPVDKVEISIEAPGYSVEVDLSKDKRKPRRAPSPETGTIRDRAAEIQAHVDTGALTYKAAWYLIKEAIDEAK